MIGSPPFIEVENLTFGTGTSGSASDTSKPLTVFVGQGPYHNDDGTVNGTARGVVVTISSGFSAYHSGSTYAFNGSGSVALVGFSGLTFGASNVTVKYNDTGAPNAGLDAANIASVEGTVTLTLPSGVSFTGPMSFSYSTTTGQLTISLGGSALGDTTTPDCTTNPTHCDTFTLGDAPAGGTAPLTVSIASGTIVAGGGTVKTTTPLVASATFGVPGFDSSLSLAVSFDTAAGTFSVATTDSTITIKSPGGQTLGSLRGNFGFSQTLGSATGNAQPPKIVSIAFSSVTVTIGTVTASATSGLLVIGNGGIAGDISGVTLTGLPATSVLKFTGSLDLQVNTTTAAVSQSVSLGGTTVQLSVPAGPYLRLVGHSISLTVAGQTVSGDFDLEQAVQGTATVTRITASNIQASFGDGSTSYVTLAGGSGILVLTGSNVAGQIGGNVSVAIPGVTLTGTLQLELNTDQTNPVTQSISFGAQPSGTDAVTVGDVNGDGRPDLIVATSGGAAYLYVNDGNADPYNTLAAIQLPGVNGGNFAGLALADVNGDNHPDLIVANSTGNNELLIGDGKGNFTLDTTHSLGTDGTAVAVGDLTGDGLADVILANSGVPTAYVNNGATPTGTWQGFKTAAAVASAPGDGSGDAPR